MNYITDTYRSLRAAFRFFLREQKYRAEKRKRQYLCDPFTPAIENTVKRIIREQKEKP